MRSPCVWRACGMSTALSRLHQLQWAVASLAEHHVPHSSCGESCKRSCSVAAPDWQVAVSRLRILAARRGLLARGAGGSPPSAAGVAVGHPRTCVQMHTVSNYVSSTASYAARRRVESLVLGALSSSPVHRTLVLVSGTNIAVLLCC